MTVPSVVSKGFSPDLTLSGARVTYTNPLLDYRKPVFNVNQYSTRNINANPVPFAASNLYNTTPTKSRPGAGRTSERIGSAVSDRTSSRGSLPPFHINHGTCPRSSPGGYSLEHHVDGYIKHEQQYIERALNLKRFRLKQETPQTEDNSNPILVDSTKLFQDSQRPQIHVVPTDTILRCHSQELEKLTKLENQAFDDDHLNVTPPRCLSEGSVSTHSSSKENIPLSSRSKRVVTPISARSSESVKSIVADIVSNILEKYTVDKEKDAETPGHSSAGSPGFTAGDYLILIMSNNNLFINDL